DRWLSSLAPAAFDSVFVLLRRTFGAFEAAERRQIMALLLDQAPRRTTGFGTDVDVWRSAEVLATVRCMLGIGPGQLVDECSGQLAEMPDRGAVL
ncbi:MAG: ABC-type taurine transport system ATPase subunit, partial [Ilumatobacter sp.]